jgi:nucleoside-diphosphate-sugar epimerase
LLLLLAASSDYDIQCFVRPTSRVELLGDVELAYGDAGDEESLARALQGVDAFVHIAGIEYMPQVLSAMRRAGVERLIVISSTSAHSAFEHRSGPRLSMEARVRESGLDWTIVRPSMIYGSELDHNMHKLLRFLDRSPVFPIFGSGENLWQPVYYKDLAEGVFSALEREESVGQAYDLPGARPLPYLDLVHTAAHALGKSPRIVHLPLEPVRWTLSTAERIRLPLPIKSEQVLRLREDKAYPYGKARQELDYSPGSFPDGISLEVARLREIGLVSS